ncbi:MAG: GerMN domain-containing protein [Merdibacter sp.]
MRSIVRKWKWSYRELIPFLIAGVLTCVGLLLLLPDETESEVHIQQNADASYLQVYLMDEDHLLVPLFFSQEADNDPQRQIEVMVEYLSGKQPLEGFQSFFTQEDVLDSVEVSDGRATLCFNERFLSYDAQDELRLVEALVWGTTQFSGVEEVVFQLTVRS